MNIVTGSTLTGAAAVFPEDIPLVVVHDGSRGPRGFPGIEGGIGPQGAGINVMGAWADGETYCPGDAVTSASSANAGVQSLWVQRSSQPCDVSALAPASDLTRWSEIGATDLSNITGSIWGIYQLAHGFEFVGQPVCFSVSTGRWELAVNRLDGNWPVAVVREVLSADAALLQSSGEIPYLDPRAIYPAATTWDFGKLYYVSSALGRVQLDPPSATDANRFIQPILVPTLFNQNQQPGEVFGVVLPWRPTPVQIGAVYAPTAKFYYTGTAGQTVLQGVDLRGNTLAYVPGDNTDVFKAGLNLSSLTDYTAANGTTITLSAPLTAGAAIEVWTLAAPLALVLPATAAKLDNIQSQFDGVQTTFTLTVNGGTQTLIASAAAVFAFIDGNAQEPFEDYTLISGVASTQIVFAYAPLAGERFWATAALLTP